MKQNYSVQSTPTANLAVNKSRLKAYSNGLDLPTYYLQNGTEFQIELFNPTGRVTLAKITLNGQSISQGGLVLKPGERVFLDRYLDIPKKFLFETYEVSNTNEVLEAIKENGDIKIEFFYESNSVYFGGTLTSGTAYYNSTTGNLGSYTSGTPTHALIGTSTSLSANLTNYFGEIINCSATLGKKTKSIETGRIDKGSSSNQKISYVNKSFEYFPFHTVEYKMLPISQKINTVNEIKVKVYCTTCGNKIGKTDHYCSKCGKKI